VPARSSSGGGVGAWWCGLMGPGFSRIASAGPHASSEVQRQQLQYASARGPGPITQAPSRLAAAGPRPAPANAPIANGIKLPPARL
jgi:hypothetical protein